MCPQGQKALVDGTHLMDLSNHHTAQHFLLALSMNGLFIAASIMRAKI